MLYFLLTIIAGFIAAGFICSFIISILVARKEFKDEKRYKENVGKSLDSLREKGLLKRNSK